MLTIQFDDFANVLSVISSTMTILGVGGILGWSFLKKDRGRFEKTVIGIAVYSLKAILCLIFLGVILALMIIPHTLILTLTVGVSDSSKIENFTWDSGHALNYLIAYGIECLFVFPLSYLLCSSVFRWSIEPFQEFGRLWSRTGKNP